jgi:hypothetical protein
MSVPNSPRLLVSAAVLVLGLIGADRSVGTWTLNAAKSKSTSSNAVKSRTEVYEEMPDGGVRITRSDQRADGGSSRYSYTFKCDGKEYPVTGTLYDTIACKRLDSNTTIMDLRKSGGKLRITTRNLVSKDGKTKTQINTGIDVDGKPFTSTYVYDKQ